MSVAVTKAIELGFTTVGCASTGNLAHSVAAHAAQAGLEAVVIIPHDLEEGKIVATQVFGPRMIKVRGNYDEVNRLCTQIASEYPVRAGQRQPAAVLHRGRQDPRLRDRRAARLAAAASHRGAGRRRHHPAQGVEGLSRAVRARTGRGQPAEDLRRAAGGLQSGVARDRAGRATRSGRRSRRPSPRASPSATRPTATSCSTWCVSRAAMPRRRPTARSSPRSTCWRAPKRSSPSPPAAPRWRARSASSSRDASRATSRSWCRSPATG